MIALMIWNDLYAGKGGSHAGHLFEEKWLNSTQIRQVKISEPLCCREAEGVWFSVKTHGCDPCKFVFLSLPGGC